MATQHISNPFIYQKPKPKKGLGKALDSITDFLVEYWAHIVTVILGSLVLCAISVPFLSYLGLDSISKPIFFWLHLVCAQIPGHSFYIFGHQLGLCERNFSIYTSMFIGSLIFVLTKKRMRGIPWWFWMLMMLPMAWDGTTQMFGWRESDWILRVVTGTLFGAGNIWFALPMMQKSLTETTVPQIPPALLKRYQKAGLAPATSAITTMAMSPTIAGMSVAMQAETVSQTQATTDATKRFDVDTRIQTMKIEKEA
jgi:uncharacterized membrane protein